MKPQNFPARKLKRQLVAKGVNLESPEATQQLNIARNIRTKKYRGKK